MIYQLLILTTGHLHQIVNTHELVNTFILTYELASLNHLNAVRLNLTKKLKLKKRCDAQVLLESSLFPRPRIVSDSTLR